MDMYVHNRKQSDLTNQFFGDMSFIFSLILRIMYPFLIREEKKKFTFNHYELCRKKIIFKQKLSKIRVYTYTKNILVIFKLQMDKYRSNY